MQTNPSMDGRVLNSDFPLDPSRYDLEEPISPNSRERDQLNEVINLQELGRVSETKYLR